METFLRITLVQTTLDYKAAWSHIDSKFPLMHKLEADRIWLEIMSATHAIGSLDDTKKPHIVILPEFGIPLDKEKDIIAISDSIGSIVISGLDFQKDGLYVRNEGFVAIPYNWPNKKGISRKKCFHFGKVFPAAEEKEMIESYMTDSGNLKFKSAEAVYILDLEEYGKVGLAICADFYDLNRFVVYRGRIQHLILIAYNKDCNSFLHLAEAISRIVFCNVVICNTGFYGGSLVFTPAEKPYMRYIYRHEGADLYTMQTINLPVDEMYKAQKGKSQFYKSCPPGFSLIGDEKESATTQKELKIESVQ